MIYYLYFYIINFNFINEKWGLEQLENASLQTFIWYNSTWQKEAILSNQEKFNWKQSKP